MKKFTITSAQIANETLSNMVDGIYTATYGTLSNHIKQAIETKLTDTFATKLAWVRH